MLALAAVPATARAADPTWRLAQPDPPAGAAFKVPLGVPGDLQFWAPNRGLLAVEGNETVPRGLLTWDGASWTQLSTVCGGAADTTRIVWAGPSEFWTITEPSRPRAGAGLGLCHFKDGEVAASYSTADSSPDPYRAMNAGVCNGPSDCWFAGVGATDASGQRIGGFHLHWDGTALSSSYAPQGRGASDLAVAFGRVWETTVSGARPGASDAPPLLTPDEPDSAPHLIQFLAGDAFTEDPFQIIAPAGTPPDGSDLLALAAGDDALWAVGGGAASGPSKPSDGSVPRPPVAARRTRDDSFAEVPFDRSQFTDRDRFVDVATAGDGSAFVAVQAAGESRSTNARARVARLGADGATTVTTLPTSGSGRGAAARIAFPAPGEGWLVTTGGWLFHYTDGTPLVRDTDPAFAKLITFRPNEAAEQFVPDDPPEDDSQLFAPPPVEVVAAATPDPVVTTLKPLLRHVRTKLRKLTLIVSFKLTRVARVGLVARRKGKVVARTRVTRLRPGTHRLRLKLSRKHYPTALKFITKEKGQAAPDDGTTVTTR